MAISTQVVRIVDGRLMPIPGVWQFDTGHTEVGFEGRHLMISRVRGRFSRFIGKLVVAENPEDSVAELIIDATSVESGFKDRDDHLKSPDWFDVDRYPTITFDSRTLRHVSGSTWEAEGDLTIKGITRPIEVMVEFFGAIEDPWGNSKIGARVTADVDRADWGLNWNMPLEAGGLVVSGKIQLTVNAEAVMATE